MADIGYNIVENAHRYMDTTDIQLSRHARMQMQRRRVTLEDVHLGLLYGVHVAGREKGTGEACIELDGRPLMVVYDAVQHEISKTYYVVTVLRRRCRE